MPTAQPGNQAGALVPRRRDELAEAIVVPNTLWQAADPIAYGGGQPTEITHLREVEASGAARRDNGRWAATL
jgi:hypothetical protein